MTIGPSSTLQKNENVAFRRLAAGEGGVLLHLESGEYHGINEVGCLIWEHLDGERTVDAGAGALPGRIGDPPSHRRAAGMSTISSNTLSPPCPRLA